MKILERVIQYPKASVEEVMAKEKAFEKVADRVGMPRKRRYWAGFGKETFGTFIFDRVWDSLAQMEEMYAKLQQQPEMAEIRKMPPDMGASYHEIYYLIED